MPEGRRLLIKRNTDISGEARGPRPYKVLRYWDRADRVVRPYMPFCGGNPWGRPRAG